MGHTNETANVGLSQFLGTDKPAWLVDYNGDMAKIDAYSHATRVKANANENAITALANRVGTIETTITNSITPALTSAQNNITILQGNITTINSLIGNGTPTTTDQTLIGAINEINGNLTNLETSLDLTDVESDITPDGTNINWSRIDAFKSGHFITFEVYGVTTGALSAGDNLIVFGTEKAKITQHFYQESHRFYMGANDGRLRAGDIVPSGTTILFSGVLMVE